ncbi:hypothetical protein [Rhodopseudomonas palustris]|uniref:hypothetical protein n=1 Tax=Rhodopseudomonas palustris TaxID=1076 RepID=UPI0002D272C3|nr:hypothetical protein [Rhodopseudomonas palustris]
MLTLAVDFLDPLDPLFRRKPETPCLVGTAPHLVREDDALDSADLFEALGAKKEFLLRRLIPITIIF